MAKFDMHMKLILILKIMKLPQAPLYATSKHDISRIRIAMNRPHVSFEFFPPKSLEASFRLWDTLGTLAPLDPQFVSVTYGAGGTTRALTHDAVKTIHKNYGVPVAAHLTCVDATREETLEIAKSYAEAGVTEIVALRGDPPKGQGRFTPHAQGFTGSVDLIEALAKTGNFTLRVGAYPDPHPEAATMQDCVDHLKRKIDAGATSAITQFFFEADTFFRFRDACAASGITAPIIPGILPVNSWKGVRKFAEACGTHIPTWLDEAYDKAIRDNREALLSTALCTELCAELVEGGADALHFYTLNTPDLTREVCAALGVTPRVELSEVA
jgi:methylenetetrahydrofolate reductase (NADPH)